MARTVSPLMGRLTTPTVVHKLFAPSAVPKRFAAFPLEMALRPVQLRSTSADTALMVPAAASLSRRYEQLKLPITIVAGEGDKIVDCQAQSERLHQLLPQSRLVRIPHAGHMIHHIALDEVLLALKDVAAKA
jgi:pimeloyl-ACP methyl ester carboxylesterase